MESEDGKHVNVESFTSMPLIQNHIFISTELLENDMNRSEDSRDEVL